MLRVLFSCMPSRLAKDTSTVCRRRRHRKPQIAECVTGDGQRAHVCQLRHDQVEAADAVGHEFRDEVATDLDGETGELLPLRRVAVLEVVHLLPRQDHRIVDGREAVTFLKRIKECVENPERIMMEI